MFDKSQKKKKSQFKDKKKFEEINFLEKELIDTLIDLFFCIGFTLSHIERFRNRITYAIRIKGVGCNTSMSSNKDLKSNRIKRLRLFLTLFNKSLYIFIYILSIKEIKIVTYIIIYSNKQFVFSLLYSQFNIVLYYNFVN